MGLRYFLNCRSFADVRKSVEAEMEPEDLIDLTSKTRAEEQEIGLAEAAATTAAGQRPAR